MLKVRLRRRDSNPLAEMSLINHLRELRLRIIIILIAVAVGSLIGYYWYDHQLYIFGLTVRSAGELLAQPYCSIPSPPRAEFTRDGHCRLLAVGLFDQFSLRLRVAVIVGIVMTCPVWAYQIWLFIAPGLHPKEKKYSRLFLALGSFLFILGAVLAYILLPNAFDFLLGIGSSVQVTALQGDKYFDFLINVFVIFGVCFEVPLVILALNFMGIVSYKRLQSWQRGIVFSFFILTAIVTPGQDPFTMLALTAALIVLFEITVVVCFFHDRWKKQKQKVIASTPDDAASDISEYLSESSTCQSEFSIAQDPAIPKESPEQDRVDQKKSDRTSASKESFNDVI